jgi:hypothetical protein
MEDCLICGKPLGTAKFVTKFKDRLLHVTCEQSILNEPAYEAGIFYDYGLHGARGTHPEDSNYGY